MMMTMTMVLDLFFHLIISCCIILLTIASDLTSDDEIERTPNFIEKVAIAEKVKLTESLNNLFSKADEIFNKNDEQKLMFDDAGSFSKPDEITIPQAPGIYIGTS